MTIHQELQPDTELYIIRHAESVLNANPGIINGRSDSLDLTVRGIGQAIRLGEELVEADIIPDITYVSPAIRSQKTAYFCLQAMGLKDVEPKIADDLHEVSQGDWEGLPREDTYSPGVLRAISRAPRDFAAPGGESINEAYARGHGFLTRVATSETLELARPRVILAFSHGFFTRILAGTMLQWPTEEIRLASTPNTSLNLLTHGAEGWQTEFVGKDVAYAAAARASNSYLGA